MSLVSYRSKRNFSSTAEPKGRKKVAAEVTRRKAVLTRPSASSRRLPPKVLFVIQKHAATRLHYDFRLELEGVLKSWAVPKGIPMVKGEKHLAVEVEDHPVEYANLEIALAAEKTWQSNRTNSSPRAKATANPRVRKTPAPSLARR